MKTVKLFFGILCISFLFVSSSFAQDKTAINMQRHIKLDNSSKTTEVKIEVTEKDCRFYFKISSIVNLGEVKIEIYDHEGKKQGNFSVGCQLETNNAQEQVSGEIRKDIMNASLGTWRVKIIPKNAKGDIRISYGFNNANKK